MVVVSPHRDDAAFSCSIAIRELQKITEVRVSNYFTTSEYAPFRSTESGSVSELRRREDESFAELTGVRLEDLDLIDAPQRLSIRVSEISTLRTLDSGDAEPREKIREHIRSLAPDLLLIPLAIGDHIDHRIAQAGAMEAGIRSMAFYEDLPYSARATEDTARIRAADLGLQLTPWTMSSGGAKQWKERCCSLYRSQIDSSTVREIADFCERNGEGERYWVNEPAADLFRSLQFA